MEADAEEPAAAPAGGGLAAEGVAIDLPEVDLSAELQRIAFAELGEQGDPAQAHDPRDLYGPVLRPREDYRIGQRSAQRQDFCGRVGPA